MREWSCPRFRGQPGEIALGAQGVKVLGGVQQQRSELVGGLGACLDRCLACCSERPQGRRQTTAGLGDSKRGAG